MKKTLVSALTIALVVGAASTTFAAANPFSDVPADHWAYDAVAQLAADGVIEGYGDSTFKGDKNITRYEMAQMVAKAMAKSTSGADKALVDKLAAEFADELNNLGVRVANLERNADVVKWTGEARFTVSRYGAADTTVQDSRKNELLLRLEPTAEINSNWKVKARLDTALKIDADDENQVTLKRIWAQGNYDNLQVRLGKFASYDNDTVFDKENTGVDVTFGKDVKGTIGYARLNKANAKSALGSTAYSDVAANHFYVGAAYAKDKLNLGLSYHDLKGENKRGADKKAHIWVAKAGYKFLPTLNAKAFYSKNTENIAQDQAAGIELNYKGAKAENQGSFGAWVAYRHIGKGAVVNSTWDVTRAGEKDFEIGANYTLFKNVVLTGRYGLGKTIDGDHKTHNAFGRVEFFF
ncbi:S-layer homology domain-containing protein [Selenomonas sp. GACV-9]|uniref:porin n=1 Tax=Selenomonas sp. GACV-9 TaxID=3158782 RepID=UPI0008E2E923|nr:S-layer homology domain-containing protein [Selenomonas ruminantium]